MKINSLLLLGAGPITLKVGQWALKNGIETVIAANESQFCRKINGIEIGEIVTSLRIKVYKADNFNELNNHLDAYKTDGSLAISVGAPWIFSHEFLQKFPTPILNLHGTNLPKGRGGTLFSWLILTGQRTGMCLLHQIKAGIDDGPIVAYDEFIYPANCRIPKDFINFYEEKNTQFIIEFISNYTNQSQTTIQPEYLSTYWPRLLANVHGWIDWTWNFVEIERQICAFDDPYGGARCRFQDKTVIVRDAWAQASDGYTHPFQHGLVYRNNGKWINVAVKGGELLICSVKDENGNNLLPIIKPGDRLFSSPEDLLQATQRVIKTSQGLKIQKI